MEISQVFLVVIIVLLLNSIPGLGTVAAEGIYAAVQENDFTCVEELKEKAGIGKSVVELLHKFNCLDGLPESNQISLFV